MIAAILYTNISSNTLQQIAHQQYENDFKKFKYLLSTLAVTEIHFCKGFP